MYSHVLNAFFFQGLTILFLVVTMCSDLLCLVLLPVHWLFFAASTYVWVQFVWNTGTYWLLCLSQPLNLLKSMENISALFKNLCNNLIFNVDLQYH